MTTPPFVANWRAAYRFFAAFFFAPFCLLRHLNPPFRWFGLRERRAATTQRTLPPGTSARVSAPSLRGLTPGRRSG